MKNWPLLLLTGILLLGCLPSPMTSSKVDTVAVWHGINVPMPVTWRSEMTKSKRLLIQPMKSTKGAWLLLEIPSRRKPTLLGRHEDKARTEKNFSGATRSLLRWETLDAWRAKGFFKVGQSYVAFKAHIPKKASMNDSLIEDIYAITSWAGASDRSLPKGTKLVRYPERTTTRK
ncbi:hypothetical protein EON81_05605 [bacterium]|nr:MAG: hypothetical protein EON81_05605 [bacterium]